MSTSSRIAPLRSLLESRIRPLDTEPWLGRLPADPQRAWAGRVRLDRARVESRPDDADAWWRLGVGLHALGRSEASAAAFLRALRRDLEDHGSGSRHTLVIGDMAPGRTLVDDVFGAEVPDLQLHWICSRPVVFDAAQARIEEANGRAYRLDPGLTAVILPSLRSKHVVGALATHAREIHGLPSHVRRVRIPVRLVEDTPDDAAGFDALLAPSRASHDAWANRSNVHAVVWPRSDESADRDGVLELAVSSAPDAPGTWTEEDLRDLLFALRREIPGLDIRIRVHPSRRPAIERTRLEVHSMVEGTGSIRCVDHEDGSRAHRLVVVEPRVDLWTEQLARPGGLVVFDPGGREQVTTAPVPTARSPLQVVENVHAYSRDPREFESSRHSARARLLDHDEKVGALPLSRALREVLGVTDPESATAEKGDASIS